MATLSDCTQKGLYFGAITFALGTLMGENIKHRLGNAASNIAGVMAGNYIVRNSGFCDSWEEKTKDAAIFALGFFASYGSLYATNKVIDKSIQLPKNLETEAGGWLLMYLLFSEHVIV